MKKLRVKERCQKEMRKWESSRASQYVNERNAARRKRKGEILSVLFSE